MSALDLTPKQRREIKRLEKVALDARNAIYAIQGPVAEARAKALVGHHYRFHNSYGRDSKAWWGYVKVLRADGEHLEILRFEVRPDCVVVQPKEHAMPLTVERYEAISPGEYARQYQLMLTNLEKIGT